MRLGMVGLGRMGANMSVRLIRNGHQVVGYSRSEGTRTAAADQRRDPPELVAGDSVDDLAAAADRIPAELPLVVFTSHMLPYLAEQRRERFVAALAELASARPLWWVSNGPHENGVGLVSPGRDELSYERTGQCVLALTQWRDGEPATRLLAQTHPHGRRMTWLGGSH
jgi:hypothetical protein